jgi:hypothetical protein
MALDPNGGISQYSHKINVKVGIPAKQLKVG